MKARSILLATAILLFAFVSCDKQDYNGDPLGRTPVKFSPSIDGSVQTKASGNAWDKADQIGVFMKKAGQVLSAANIVDDADNKLYETLTGDGTFTPQSGHKIYYPQDGSKVDFIAYYPRQHAISNLNYAIDVTNQASQPAIDLLYADNAKNLDKNTPQAPLGFSHQLSKLVFNINAGAGVSSLDGLTVKITGMKTKAAFALSNGTITLDGASVADINVKATKNNNAVLGEAIVIPVADAAGCKVIFTLAGKTYTWTIPDATEYKKGNKYTYDVTLKNSGAQESDVSFKATITDWTTGADENISIVGEGNSDPTPTEPEEFFKETFGTTTNEKAKFKIEEYTAYLMGSPIKYSIPQEKKLIDIRTTKGFLSTNNLHIWLPAPTKDNPDNTNTLLIEGIETGYSDIILNYDIATNTAKTNANVIKIKCNGVEVEVPSLVFDKYNEFKTISIKIPDNTTKIEFCSDKTNTSGYRLDNIKLIGVKK